MSLTTPPSVCVNCGIVSPTTPQVFIKSNIPYLSQCSHCGGTLDKYVEYNGIILCVQLLLIRLSLYVHLIYSRIAQIPVFKLVVFMLGWLGLTSFGFSLSAAEQTFSQLLSFDPYSQAVSTTVYPTITLLPSNLVGFAEAGVDLINSNVDTISSDNADNIIHYLLPQYYYHQFQPHILNLWALLTQGLPTFTIPVGFKSLFCLDLVLALWFVLIFGVFVHIVSCCGRSSGRQQQEQEQAEGRRIVGGDDEQQQRPSSSPTLFQTIRQSFNAFVTGQLGRAFLLLSFFGFQEQQRMDTRIYFAVQICYALMSIVIASCAFYHITPGFYTMGNKGDGVVMGVGDGNQQQRQQQPANNNKHHHQPNFHQMDVFSFWNHTIPVIFLFIVYIIPMGIGIKQIYPNIDLGLHQIW